MKLIPVLLILLMSISYSCSNRQSKKQYKTNEESDRYNKSLEAANRYLSIKDAERIQSYAKRRNWDVQMTQTGLWYEIYKRGTGPKAEKGQVAVLKYKISLMDGTVCYTSDSLGLKIFSIGHGGVETGLEEGILLLHQGDKAHLILPPYIAHGLLGDMDKIPARSIIIYDLELVQLKN